MQGWTASDPSTELDRLHLIPCDRVEVCAERVRCESLHAKSRTTERHSHGADFCTTAWYYVKQLRGSPVGLEKRANPALPVSPNSGVNHISQGPRLSISRNTSEAYRFRPIPGR
jgi:hypothetical protein